MSTSTTSAQLPDFLIVGAMKSGTTSLHRSLRAHPDIFMPPLEIGFFDIDDIRQHPDFFKNDSRGWHYSQYTNDRYNLPQWYCRLFESADTRHIIGERSTSYMASTVAPQRIAEILPNAKIIFMIRDPVRRAYSNYWHLVRTGEATMSFHQTLRYRSPVLFDRGLYRRQIERYQAVFPDEQLLVLVFEDFITDPVRGVAEACEFIGADVDQIPDHSQRRHENRGRYPWSEHLQHACNALLFHGLLDGHRYLESHLPHLTYDALNIGTAGKIFHKTINTAFKALSRLNCSRRQRPDIEPATRQLLKYLYEDRNRGLSELIGKDLARVWPVTKV